MKITIQVETSTLMQYRITRVRRKAARAAGAVNLALTTVIAASVIWALVLACAVDGMEAAEFYKGIGICLAVGGIAYILKAGLMRFVHGNS